MRKKLLHLFFIFTFITTFLSAQVHIPEVCQGFFEGADDCESACVVCNLTPFNGSTAGFSPTTAPFCLNSTIENDQWIGFIASSASITFTVTPSNCTVGNGVQVALYPAGCNDTPITCNRGCMGCGTVPQSVSAYLIPGNIYYLMIDGFAGDECDFQVNFTPTNAAQAPTIGTSSNIAGPPTSQPGATVTYTIPFVVNAVFYTWSSSVPGVLFNGFESPVAFEAPGGRTVDVTFPAGFTGVVPICVEPSNPCHVGTQRCKTVNVSTLPPTILPKAVVCYEDIPYVLPWGQSVNTSGTYSTVLTSHLGGDSLVIQQVQVLSKIITNTTKYICVGDTINVCGSKYFQQGLFSNVCTSYRGCDSLVNLVLNVLAPKAKILSNAVIGCEQTNIVLKSTPSPNFPGVSSKKWTRPDGSTQIGDTLLVSTAGTYKLCTAMTAGNLSCTVCDSMFVIRDSLAIPIMATGGLLGCMNDSLKIITSGVQVSNPTYQWSGPNNFTSVLAAPVAYNAGNYTVTVTTAAGCSGTAIATVTQGQSIVIAASGGIISCLSPNIQLLSTSNVPNLSYQWIGPSGFQSIVPNPLVQLAGNYLLTVTDSLGCTKSTSTTVLSDTATPSVSIVSSNATCVGVDMLTANTTNVGSAPTFLWTGPGGVTSNVAFIKVDTSGFYSVTVTNTTNGCTSIQTQNAIHGNFTPQVTLDQLVNPSNGLSNGSINITVSGGIAPYTYTWSTGGLVASTSEDAIFLAPGDYICYITGADSCTSTVTYTLVNTVATQDIANQNQWTIQPNPSTGIFYLTNKNGAQSPSALHVFDILGRSVWSAPSTVSLKEMAIDLTQMPNGVYWLEIVQAEQYGGRTYKKMVVAR